MADFEITSGSPSFGASVDSPSFEGGIDGVHPLKQNYFEWRQETFQPRLHWPLNDSSGSTVKALSGPDGEYVHDITLGSDGLIRPPDRYPGMQTNSNGYAIFHDADTDFILETGVFTVGLWFKFQGGAANHLVGTVGPNSGFDSGWRMRISNHLQRIYFDAIATSGDAPQNLSFFRGDTDRTRFETDQTIHHLFAVGRGTSVSLYLDGAAVWTDGETDSAVYSTEGEQEPLTLMNVPPAFSNRHSPGIASGLVIDDRPWSISEIKADYERGVASIDLRAKSEEPFRTIFPISTGVDTIKSLDPYRYWDWRAQGEQDRDLTPSLINQTDAVETIEGRGLNQGATVTGDAYDPFARKVRQDDEAWGDFRIKEDGFNGQYWYRTDTDKTEEWRWMPEEGGTVMGAVRYDEEGLIESGGFSTSWCGHYYSFSILGVLFRYIPLDDGVAEFRIYDGEQLVWQRDSDPGLLTKENDGEEWITLGATWNDSEVIFWKNGEVWSSHEHPGLVGKDQGDATGIYPFTIGANRSGRWPWYGDIGPVAVWQRDVTEDEAQTFHDAAIPENL